MWLSPILSLPFSNHAKDKLLQLSTLDSMSLSSQERKNLKMFNFSQKEDPMLKILAGEAEATKMMMMNKDKKKLEEDQIKSS